MPKKRTHEEFVSEALNKRPNIKILGTYINANSKIQIQCECGNNEWYPLADSVLRGHKCKFCTGHAPKTTETYKAELLLLRPNIQVLEDYVDTATKILHRCECGKTWRVNPNCILRGYSCYECRNIKSANKIRLSYEEVKTYIENLGYKLLTDNYKDSHQKLILQDNYGYYYSITLNNLKQDNKPLIAHISNPYSITNIHLWCLLNNKNYTLVSTEYLGCFEDLEWRCLESNCLEKFKISWSEVSKGNGCGFCVGKQVGDSNCLGNKNSKLSKDWHPTKNGEITPFHVTISSGQKAWWICDKGHEWEATIASRNIGNGCPYCDGKKVCLDNCLATINPELSKDWHYEKNINTPYDITSGSGKYAWWICSRCNCEWQAVIYSRNKGVGCPKCAESKGEQVISQYLNTNNFIRVSNLEYNQLSDIVKKECYVPQKEFYGLLGLRGGNLSYDFYIPKHNLLCEFQGEQHVRYVEGFHSCEEDFERQLVHDKLKKEYAFSNEYNFLEIWYWDFHNIEQILENKLNELKLKSVV